METSMHVDEVKEPIEQAKDAPTIMVTQVTFQI